MTAAAPTGDNELLRKADLKRLGERVRELRQAASVTQQQLSDELGVNRSTIIRFEAGTNDIGASRLLAVARVLGVKPSDFLD